MSSDQNPIDNRIEEELEAFAATERQRLGLDEADDQWVEPIYQKFTAAEKGKTTLLISGLTHAHDIFLQAAFRRQGYQVVVLDSPDNAALRLGKEFGNRGQCNPTYFTVGNLVQYLTHMRDVKGHPVQDILDNFIYITAGSCGPCRFGMYVTEYRKALRDSGFDGFRVMLLAQSVGMEQVVGEGGGLDITTGLAWNMLNAVMIGDILNARAYRIRPYELEEGATDSVLQHCRDRLAAAIAGGHSLGRVMKQCRRELDSIRVDRTRVRPKVAIIGEFWAMTTEGDGNYRLQRFLEEEGAEVDVQPVTAWLLYIIWENLYDTQQQRRVRSAEAGSGSLQKLLGMKFGDRLLRFMFQRNARLMGLRDYHMPDMEELAEISHKYYNNQNRGGEGHMEVGKLIQNVVHNKVNMTISVKPFGCMPSSGVSDGVQSVITELLPDAIFLPIETTGDGAVNVYSRIQMQLFKARKKAGREVQEALQHHGITMPEVQEWLRQHPRRASASHRSPHRAGCVSADLVHEVGQRMGRRRRLRRPVANAVGS